MVDLKICNEKIKSLGLHFPTTAEKEKLAFIKLTREYNPDLCETSECKIVSEPRIVEIMKAHLFWKENNEVCNKIANDFVNKVVDDHLHHFELLHGDVQVLKDAAAIFKAAGWDFV
jgi:hypothetical protein